MKKKIIMGAGGGKGGGGSGRVAVEAPDSLQSKAFAKVIDLVSEGEIEGLVDGYKSIYLDGTPLQNEDGTFNFRGVLVESRNGTQSQEYIPRFSAAENQIAVGVEVTETAVVRTITDQSVDAIRVLITIPQLTEQNTSNGDLGGSEVSYAIDLQSNGGGYQEVITDTIIGKCVSKYERAYRVELEGDGPWDIRVRRVTPVSLVTAIQNRTIWSSYTEVIDGKLAYPNSALVAIEIDSSQFTSIPTRGYDVKLLKIRVPSNYDPETREYTGSWDGTFQIAWTDNPAWIFYDLITSERYGLGGFIPEDQVDKWGLYTIAQYCDELVDDGEDGLEPRFTCNVYLQSREEAFKVLQDIASCFRGMLYWSSGIITVVQDAPDDASHLFTAANVVEGKFSYSGSSAKKRHTVAQVSWNDPEDFYKQKIEYVEDLDGIARFGLVETQIAAFGCTSRAQANRLGRWLLYSEQYQTETVTFQTGIEGAVCRPGQIIKIADPMRAGTRRAGRIQSATLDTLILDQEYLISTTHTISVLLPDGTVEEKTILSSGSDTVQVASNFSQAPQPGAIYMLSSVEIEPQLFKIIGVTENLNGTHDVVALSHDESKFDYIETGLRLEPRSISTLSEVPDSPTNLTLTETLYEVNGDVRVKVTVSWDYVQGASSYIVQYSRDSGNPITLPQTSSNDVEILNAEPGIYYVSVWAVNPIGVKSVPTTGEKRIVGKTLPPADVEGFSLFPMNGSALLSWDKSLDLDVTIGGSVRIRYTPNIVDPEWRNSVDIAPALAGNATRAQVPLLSGTYMAKFVDSSGIASENAASIQTTVPDALARNIVETVTEDPAWAGNMTDMEYNSDYGGIVIASLYIDSVLEDVDDIENWDFIGGVRTSGTYDFTDVVDLTATYVSRVTAHILAESRDVTDNIDERMNDCDDWVDLDGAFIDTVNAELFVRTTLDDPNDLGAEWTAWKRFFVGEYEARGFQFQLRATSTDDSHTIVIQELAVTIDMADRVLNMRGLTSGTSTYSVAYTEPYAAVPAIGITAKNMASGDYYQISNETKNGFDIIFKNSAGTGISRNFDVLAKGYGRQIT